MTKTTPDESKILKGIKVNTQPFTGKVNENIIKTQINRCQHHRPTNNQLEASGAHR